MPAGAEPACWNASLLLATCYLSQDKCKAEAISLAPVVGKAINDSSCESLKVSAGGAGPLAAAFPPGLPCDSPNVANNLSQFDNTPAVSSVCSSGPKIPAPTCEAACNLLKSCGGMRLDAQLTEPYGCWNACGLQGTERARFECSAKAADCSSVTSCWEDG